MEDKSKTIYKRFLAESDTLSDLRSKLLIVEGELKKAEAVRGKTSYAALSKDDEQSGRKLEAAEDTITKSNQRIASFRAAISESENKTVQLKAEYDAAAEEEAWQKTVVAALNFEIANNAEQINSHFRGSAQPLRPFVAVVQEHTRALASVNGELSRRNIQHSDLVALFKRWMDAALHPIFRDSARHLYSQPVREELEQSYVEYLTRRVNLIINQRQQSTPKAVNE